MRIIVIGASGTIGTAVYLNACKAGHEVIGTGNTRIPKGYRQFDIERQNLLDIVPDLNANDSIILLSAYTSPGWIAQNIEKAQSLNVDASLRVIEQSNEVSARVVMLSSDQVFDGKSGAYNEESKPNPINTYGKMKVILETKILELGDRGCVVRTGWNASWTREGNCIVKETYDTLLSGQAKMATDNFMNISDVNETADGLVKLGCGSEKKIYHLVGDPPVFRSELADLIIKKSRFGEQMSYSPIKFSELTYTEERPLRSNMTNQRATSEFGMVFSSPKEIVERKVPLLDKWYEHRNVEL